MTDLPAAPRRFTRDELQAFRDTTVPDLLPPAGELRLLLVGINPGLLTAATGAHFAGPGNRFYPALHLAGITAHRMSPAGTDVGDRAHLTSRGIGITNVVARATARADELSREEYRTGGEQLRARVAHLRPRVVGVVGLTAFRIAFRRPKAVAGRQDEPDLLPPAEVWVAPNPSGLNAHATVESLARDYRALAEAAGVPLDPPRW